MLFGIVGATVTFVIMYSRLEVFSINKRKLSSAVRTFEERQILLSEQGKILTIRFRGYIFFGSAVNLIDSIKRHIKTGVSEVDDDNNGGGEIDRSDKETTNIAAREHSRLLGGRESGGRKKRKYTVDNSQLAEFVVLDFSDVRRVDSTAARGCFFMFTTVLRELKTIELIFAGLPSATLELMKANGAVYESDTVVDSLNDALYFCEEKILRR
jgi:SulP family sulfate permease